MERIDDIYGKVDRAAGGFSISLENVLQTGFNHFRKIPGAYMIYSLVFLLALSNPGTGLILGGPLLIGFFLAAQHLQSGSEAGMEVFLNGFRKFIPLLILNLLMTLVITLGFLLLVIPGIYFAISYLFAPLFVWFYDVSPVEAITLSRKMVSGNFVQILWIWLILLALNFLGALALGVGLLITIPVSACVIYAIFDDVIGIH